MNKSTKTWSIVAGVVIVLALIIFGLNWIGTRSGVTNAQVSEALPGDNVISDPWIAIDRAGTMPASASTTWPWVAQLGANRGGWYAPLWLENALHEYAASSTEPQFQNLSVGEIIPDFGGGKLQVILVSPGNYVVYGSVPHGATSTPYSVSPPTGPYNFTWALVLENDTPTSTSFHLRLRITKPTTNARYIPGSLPGLIDYATDIVMFWGLQERLK
jgi:hypothetical protein